MSEAATITPESFSNSTGNSIQTRTVQPPNPEYVARQQAEASDLFDNPGVQAEFVDDNQQQAPATPAPAATPEPTPEPAPATSVPSPAQPVDPTTLSAAMVEALKASGFTPQQQQQAAAPSTELSPEEFNRLTNHFEVTPEFLQQLDHEDPATRVANYNAFIDGIRKNTLTMAYHAMQGLKTELLSQVQPLLQQTQEQQTQAMQQEFSSKYPALANPAFQPILSAIVQEAKSSGKKFTKEEAFKYIAETAAQTIKAVNPSFELGVPNTTPTKQNSTTMPAPNGSPSGGGGGAGNSTRKNAKTTVDAGVAIFD